MSKLTLAVDITNRNIDLEPLVGATVIEPHFNDDWICNLLVVLATTLETKVCFVDHIDYYGKKANGLYTCKNGRRMIYIDKHLKGHKLRFVLMHELAHVILHSGKLGKRYRKDIEYRKRIETEADNYAMKILRNLEGSKPLAQES